MKKTKNLTLKNMKETLVNYSDNQEELDKIWNGFYLMAYLGFINENTWRKFSEQSKEWYKDIPWENETE